MANNKKTVLLISSIVIVLLLVAASVAGSTHSWFNSGADVFNSNYDGFTAGTLTINVEQIYPDSPETELTLDDCEEIGYKITNTGTKSNYLRAKFDGNWMRTLHKNEAFAEVTYNKEDIEASDKAHFKDNLEPDFSLEQQTLAGFAGGVLLEPVSFEPLDQITGGANTSYTSPSEGEAGEHLLNESPGLGIIEAEGEVFVLERDSPPYRADTQDTVNDLRELFGPGCLQSFKKIDRNDVGYEVDDEYETTLPDGFSISIINTDDGFNFTSNYPVYHVFVRGGSEGIHLYTYYIDDDKLTDTDINNIKTVAVPEGIDIPFKDGITDQYDENDNTLTINELNLSENGVTAGSGLEQVDGNGDWSHAVFFYCVPPPEPDLELIKIVSLDGGINWYTSQRPGNTERYNQLLDLLIDDYGYDISGYDYEEQPVWPSINDGVVPQFKIVVANTGNVPLEGINVTDDYFTDIDHTFNLGIGEVWFSPIITYDGYLEPLPTGDIKIKLAPANTEWNPNEWSTNPPGQDNIELGDYIYYNDKINSEEEILLYIEVCLDPNDLGSEYSYAVFNLYAYFEAVQSTHNMDDTNWNVQIPISE